MRHIIRRMAVAAMMLLTTGMTVVAQDIYSGSTSLVDINNQWEKETLSGVADGSLIGMLECFNKRWPTWMVKSALTTMKKGKQKRIDRNGDGLPTVYYEPRNGWVDVASNVMCSEFMHVCYWKRNNGHLLLAIYFGKPCETNLHFVCFYDYAPQKGTLTPEPHIIDGYRTTEDTKFYYDLPREGKDLVILEFGPRGQIRHTFKWNGMKPVYSKSEVVPEDNGGENCEED